MKKTRKTDEFSERLRLAMKNAGISHADLARRMGTAWSTVARWHAGSMPRAKTMLEIASVLGVASRWLKSGEGEMKSAMEDAAWIAAWDADAMKRKESEQYLDFTTQLDNIVRAIRVAQWLKARMADPSARKHHIFSEDRHFLESFGRFLNDVECLVTACSLSQNHPLKLRKHLMDLAKIIEEELPSLKWILLNFARGMQATIEKEVPGTLPHPPKAPGE